MADTAPPELNEARARLLHHADDVLRWETLNQLLHDLQALDDRLARVETFLVGLADGILGEPDTTPEA